MATVKEINHDSSTTIGDHYSSVTDTDGAVTVTGAAALASSTYGVEMYYGAGTALSVLEEDFTTLTGDDFRWRIRLDLSNMSNPSSTLTFASFRLRSSGGDNIFVISLSTTSPPVKYRLTSNYYNDSGVPQGIGGNADLSTSSQICVEMRAIRETADGNADGIAEIFLDGVSQGLISNAENFNQFNLGISRARIEFPSLDPDHQGILYYDEWILDNDNAAGLGCPPPPVFSGYDLIIGGGQP